MLSKTVYSMIVLTVAFTSSSLSAQSATDVCKLAMTRIQPQAERTSVQAEFAQLPNTCLKDLYLQCSRESSQRLLGFGEATWCSFGHETLLKSEFGGDFNALLTWWKTYRDDPVGR